MTQKTETKSYKSAKDFVIEYLLSGHTALTDAMTEGNLSKAKAKQVVALLKEQGRDTTLLEQSFNTGLRIGNGRGRPSAVVGDRRNYRTQQIKEDDVFVRLPVHTLGVVKGGDVSVSFEMGRLVVTKADAKV